MLVLLKYILHDILLGTTSRLYLVSDRNSIITSVESSEPSESKVSLNKLCKHNILSIYHCLVLKVQLQIKWLSLLLLLLVQLVLL